MIMCGSHSAFAFTEKKVINIDHWGYIIYQTANCVIDVCDKTFQIRFASIMQFESLQTGKTPAEQHDYKHLCLLGYFIANLIECYLSQYHVTLDNP